jgi:uncharacterized membrane protein YeaQ/YmgE (transglycosylase-associated protein family)
MVEWLVDRRAGPREPARRRDPAAAGTTAAAPSRNNTEREVLMGIVIALIVGLLVGALAKLIMPGKDPGGILITALLGVAGSVVAFLVGRSVGWYGDSGEGPGIVASILGALLVLAAYRMVVGRRV